MKDYSKKIFINCMVAPDEIYKKYENELFDEITSFEEMHYLHAYLLKFKHINGRIGQFTANPPEMFTKVLGRLRTIPIMSQ